MGTGGYFMSYCAQDEASGENKEEQIFTAFTSAVKGSPETPAGVANKERSSTA